MKLNNKTPQLVLMIGAILILLSGIVSLAISIPIGATYNAVDPNELFGHIGVVNGIAALIIGGFLLWLSRQNYSTSLRLLITGLLSIVIGHIGAIAGALLVGTTGLLLCYVAGVWFIVLGIKEVVNNKYNKS
ncbi:MAG: hypothetical protein PVF17_05985 [Ignavibacteria bacterium]|jgi:hypothetical protein